MDIQRMNITVTPEVYQLLRQHKNMSRFICELVLKNAYGSEKDKKNNYYEVKI